MDELTLPPLPEFPEGTVEVDCGPLTGGGRAISIEDGYSADQMRAYAQQAASAAVLQERERCAKVVPTNWLDELLTGKDGLGSPPYYCPDIEKLLSAIAAAIREGA